MRILYLILILISADFLFQRCANPATPTGGPKDTIPPTLIKSFPINGQTNFKEQELTLTFSEYINADKLKQSLIITPKTNVTFKHVTKRNQLIIKLNDPLLDSTTYNFNFSDGITDITEKNPAVNLSLAFSTGPFIDSMNIKGRVVDLFTQRDASGYTIGLYPLTDTLDFLTQSPVYFTTANDTGKFYLNYIKSAKYKILAFKDENRNVILDPAEEDHGFIADTITLDSAIHLLQHIPTQLQNVKPLTFINSRPTGPYVELKYNKTIANYSISPKFLHHNLSGENNDVIKIYKPNQLKYGDSLTVYSIAKDTLNNIATDTTKIVFLESNRKPSSFSANIETNKNYTTGQNIKVVFNKPILTADSTKFYFEKDSTLNYPLITDLGWNKNRTELTLTSNTEKDTLIARLSNWMLNDTTITESQRTKRQSTIDLKIDAAAFISVENDSSKLLSTTFQLNQKESYGTIKFTVTTERESFVVQLINNKNEVLYENWNEKSFTFPKVTPATYKIRVLIDSNNDGKWSAGNLLKNEEPEDIFKDVQLRRNVSLQARRHMRIQA